ncbi:MAG TPA: Asp-tRNA(Asn)/Glu-tRNA(Gln) amidotransferase subunit GatB [Patescibacteria group bacterium]|nr:Asp-tRNA(Asn)/Glu-tRNA(Gln) amidotransferase subunit GatB [Patescibacteria group bacterium]
MENKVTPIIGLEVHVELTTKSKMFCACPADHFGKSPNSQTCPVCLGLPGALPVPNKQAIEDTIKIGLALNCEVNENNHFDRKQYFYPDLPKGYQISQYDQPLCHDGYLTLDSGKKIRILRVHLEEDTGKLQHTTIGSEKVSLVDFNRSGVPLVEIVSEPDLSSSEEAKEYLKKIHAIVRQLDVTTADMEKGQMRLEPTVNLNVASHFTPLVELKNINSFNFAVTALEYEIKRQLSEWQKTGVEKTKSNKTTRGYDSVKKITFPQRLKEEAKDYRYFPEPDIPPLVIRPSVVEKIKKTLPQLPDAIIAQLIALGVKMNDAKILSKDKTALAALRANSGLDQAKLASLIVNKKIDLAADIEPQFTRLTQIGETDAAKLAPLIDQVLMENPQVVEDYKKGKITVLGFLIGQVRRTAKGADAKTISALLVDKLK